MTLWPLDSFGNRKVWKQIFDQWSKLYNLGLNAQPKIEILNGLKFFMASQVLGSIK